MLKSGHNRPRIEIFKENKRITLSGQNKNCGRLIKTLRNSCGTGRAMDGGSGREITDIDERKQEEFRVEDRYKINSCDNNAAQTFWAIITR